MKGIVKLAAVFVVLITLTLLYARWQNSNYRAFQVVTPGVLYRCGQLNEHGFRRILHEHGIKTVVNLRRNVSPKEARDYNMELGVCQQKNVKFTNISIRDVDDKASYTPEQQQEIVEGAANRFLQIMQDPVNYPRPVLVHCLAGMHRTGVMAAIYRIEMEGWPKERAIDEMRELGYIDFTTPDGLRDTVLNWKLRANK